MTIGVPTISAKAITRSANIAVPAINYNTRKGRNIGIIIRRNCCISNTGNNCFRKGRSIGNSKGRISGARKVHKAVTVRAVSAGLVSVAAVVTVWAAIVVLTITTAVVLTRVVKAIPLRSATVVPQ